MGIHGIFKEIGPGERVSLAKLSTDHYIAHDRPFRLAIDISIWLFQIQAGKGGSNPALRTFYYRLLRLLSLSIHPLFVFDGPNKPLFKRNKRVGGPGVRVASVPEFLAKQLLKEFGFPWHVAPGEAEAECALLQREGIVDAVLSEDVDTLMFGSRVTLKNWTSENSSKSPTHVNVYRDQQTKETSGLERNGMVLVALMSGGDYIPEGIPGCGPKVACDAARAGFGSELCALNKKDVTGLRAWKERLQHEIRTNESKFFSRKNSTITIPEDFPNIEVLGYYTHPCVSSSEKLRKLREALKWDQDIDFPALRAFTADAFDWRCLCGAKKFIKNLAPAMLIRTLRLRAEVDPQEDGHAQQDSEEALVKGIHGKRNHATVDGILEYRVSFTPACLVPIDLSIEEEDDQFIPAGAEEGSDAETDIVAIPSNAEDPEQDGPMSPSKTRNFRPFDPDAPDKMWIIHSFLQLGCPLSVEEYESNLKDPRKRLEAKRKAEQTEKARRSGQAKAASKQAQKNTILQYTRVTKGTVQRDREALREIGPANSNAKSGNIARTTAVPGNAATFTLPSTQIPAGFFKQFAEADGPQSEQEMERIHAPKHDSIQAAPTSIQARSVDKQTTPRRKKRRSPDFSSPANRQKTILPFLSPSPHRPKPRMIETIDLSASSSPPQPTLCQPQTATPQQVRCQPTDTSGAFFVPLPDTVTKRRRKAPLKRWQTEPVRGESVDAQIPMPDLLPLGRGADDKVNAPRNGVSEVIGSSPARSECSLPSPGDFIIALRRDASSNRSPAETNVSIPPSTSGHRHPLPSADQDHSPDNNAGAASSDLISTRMGVTSVPVFGMTSSRVQDRKETAVRPQTYDEGPSPAATAKKRHIQLRASLAGTWKEVALDGDMLDLTGDGSGWKASKGKSKIVGIPEQHSYKGSRNVWRKSAVETLDLTGA